MAMAERQRLRSVRLEPIDRLEEKVKRLVGMVERMKAEQARAAEENQRLARELDAHARAAGGERQPSRPSCRRSRKSATSSATRVGDMLEQLEALNL